MRAIVRFLGRVFAIVLAALLLVGLGCALALRVPAPLAAPARGVELARVTLVEPGGARIPGASVRVEGGRIAAIGIAARDASGPYSNSYVLPGLTDTHIHFSPLGLPRDDTYTSLLLLLHGVTTARITGGVDVAQLKELRREISNGAQPGPRYFNCGPIIDGPDPVIPGSASVSMPEEARALVATLAAEGVDCIKAYDRLDRDTVIALREAAHAHGLSIIGHTPQAVSLEDAHLDDVQHLRGAHPPFRDDDPLSYPQFLAVWERLDEAWLQELVDVSRRFDMAHTPTMIAVSGTAFSQDWESWRRTPTMRLWPPHLRDAFWSADVGLNPARFASETDFQTVRLASQSMIRTVRLLHESGVRLHTGTDSNAPNLVPGASLQRELGFFVEAGLTPEQALELSTRDSARFVGVDDAGELRVGAPADLLIFAEDPTRDLKALASLRAVVSDGRLYTREDLEGRLERYRAHYEGAAFSRVLMPSLRLALRGMTAMLRLIAAASDPLVQSG